MRFIEALSVLSKSSPYAVSTERDNAISTQLDTIKYYLYIETDIEKDFKKALSSLSASEQKIIFLCGSSGDGKSEILTRYSRQFATRANFHLDATHSFKPQDSAIETLDHLFENYDSSGKSLVVGINVGMLGNYAEEGNNEAIKSAIKALLDNDDDIPSHITFLNFENYPKFTLTENGHSSLFAKQLLQRITADEDNIIRQYFDKEKEQSKPNKKLLANFELLSIEAVQNAIVDLLFKARLIKDQFLTARALLDFIHLLLTGPKYLQDNLFDHCDNELVSKISEFDPSTKRSNLIDKFVLTQSLKLPNNQFSEFTDTLSGMGIRKGQKPESYLRLFYLLRYADIANNYHQQFSDDFTEDLIDTYATVWHLHVAYEATAHQRSLIKGFYKDLFIQAIHKYNNRNAPKLAKGTFLIEERNGYQISAQIDLKIDLKMLDGYYGAHDTNVGSFSLFFKVGSESIVMPANINLLTLMQKIVNGYRPNKHDKNTVILLDEIIEKIADIANQQDKLFISKSNLSYQVVNVDDEEYEVSDL